MRFPTNSQPSPGYLIMTQLSKPYPGLPVPGRIIPVSKCLERANPILRGQQRSPWLLTTYTWTGPGMILQVWYTFPTWMVVSYGKLLGKYTIHGSYGRCMSYWNSRIDQYIAIWEYRSANVDFLRRFPQLEKTPNILPGRWWNNPWEKSKLKHHRRQWNKHHCLSPSYCTYQIAWETDSSLNRSRATRWLYQMSRFHHLQCNQQISSGAFKAAIMAGRSSWAAMDVWQNRRCKRGETLPSSRFGMVP